MKLTLQGLNKPWRGFILKKMKRIVLFILYLSYLNGNIVAQTLEWAKKIGGQSIDIGELITIDK